MTLIKRIDLYVIKNFLTLFFATVFICSLILIMQFLWLRIGELVGKGLSFDVLVKLFFYAWLTLIPLALPLAILLASLMAFGDMGERFELLAIKTAGVSLFRIMRPLIVLVILISIGAFFFANNVVPVAQKQMWALIFSIRQKSPELNIPVGEFYDGINNMTLYVRSKNHDTGALNDVMLYDYSKGFDQASVTTADTVYVKMTEDKKNLKLIFIMGETFENLERSRGMSAANVPYRRESFKRRELLLDFDANFNEMDASFLDDQHVSKNISQLTHDIDSINVERDSLRDNLCQIMTTEKYFDKAFESVDTVNHLNKEFKYDADSLFASASQEQMQSIVGYFRSRINSTASDLRYHEITITNVDSYYNKHSVEWYRKFTLSIACFIFFFIGAPLGAIIRKGGLGMPVVVSVVMFIIYYIIDTTGIKMARESLWPVWQGMWLSSIVLFAVGTFLTYKAVHDSTLFSLDAYQMAFSRFKIKTKNIKQTINNRLINKQI